MAMAAVDLKTDLINYLEIVIDPNVSIKISDWWYIICNAWIEN